MEMEKYYIVCFLMPKVEIDIESEMRAVIESDMRTLTPLQHE